MGREKGQFKKGQVGGPGRPRSPEHLKVTRKLTKTKTEELLTRFTAMTVDELKTIVKDPGSTVLEAWVARICLTGIVGGDERKLNFMFDRLIGKVKDEVEVRLPKPMIMENLEGKPLLLGSIIEGEIEED
jgi:hypothetical protein